jgi:Skp family chaperone for outer membrane proteins
MALVMNAHVREVKVQVFGNWFTFKPGQVKPMNEDVAKFLTMDRAYMGFVGLPEICVDSPDSPEAKEAKIEALKAGRAAVIANLERQRTNLEVSLQRDLDMTGHKTDATKLATPGDMEMYRQLAEYKQMEADEHAKQHAEIAKIKETLNGTANRTVPGKTN